MANEVQPVPQKGIKEMRAQHDALVDLLIAEPTLTNAQLGQRMNRSAVSISVVRNSDAFKEAYQKRLAQHREMASAAIIQQTQAVASAALGKLEERITNVGDALPVHELRETADMALERLGFTNKSNGGSSEPPAGNNVAVLVNGDLITQARERASEVHTGSVPGSRVIEGHVTGSHEGPSSPSDVSEVPDA